jgi:hypothetical protein
MTSLSEQLSAVRKSQWEAQLDAFRTFGTRALDSAEQLIALNLKTSRTSAEQAASTFKQLLEVRTPQDLLAIGSTAQGQWQQFFSYGRELMGIATGTHVGTWSTQPVPGLPSPLQIVPAPTANVPTSVPQALEQAAIAAADAATMYGEIASAAADTGSALAEATLDAGREAIERTAQAAQDVQATAQSTAQAAVQAASRAAAPAAPTELQARTAHAAPAKTPVAPAPVISAETLEQVVAVAPPAPAPDPVETAIADAVPPAKEKPLAKALNDVAPKPAAAEHPIASTVPLAAGPDVELPPVAPVDATPPLRVVTQAPASKSSRSSRKK